MLELTVRLVVSLAIVVGLLLLIAKVAGRRFHGSTGSMVQVVHRQPLSRTSSLAVVTVGGRVLVLGTTEHQVSLLTELDPFELELADDIELDLADQSEPAGTPTGTPAGSPTESPTGPLAGSLLSPATWRQALAATSRIGRAS